MDEDDDGCDDEITYNDIKMEPSSYVHKSSEIVKRSIDSNSAIDARMGLLLGDTFRSRKSKPDNAFRSVLDSSVTEEWDLSHSHDSTYGPDFNPFSILSNSNFERPLITMSPDMVNMNCESGRPIKNERDFKDVALDRPAHWSTFLAKQPRRKIQARSTNEARREYLEKKSASKPFTAPFTITPLRSGSQAGTGTEDPIAPQSLSYLPSWMKSRSPSTGKRQIESGSPAAEDCVDDFPPQDLSEQSHSHARHPFPFLSPSRNTLAGDLPLPITPGSGAIPGPGQRSPSERTRQRSSSKAKSAVPGASLRSALDRITREMDGNEDKLQSLLCPIQGEEVRPRRPGDLQDPRNRARSWLQVTILSVLNDAPPFHAVLAFADKTSDGESAQTDGQKDQRVQQGKLPRQQLLAEVENNAVLLYMKPNPLRGAGKQIREGNSIRLYDPSVLRLHAGAGAAALSLHFPAASTINNQSNLPEPRFIVLLTQCWEIESRTDGIL